MIFRGAIKAPKGRQSIEAMEKEGEKKKRKEMDGLRHPEGKNGDMTAIALAERADSASKEKENGI